MGQTIPLYSEALLDVAPESCSQMDCLEQLALDEQERGGHEREELMVPDEWLDLDLPLEFLDNHAGSESNVR